MKGHWYAFLIHEGEAQTVIIRSDAGAKQFGQLACVAFMERRADILDKPQPPFGFRNERFDKHLHGVEAKDHASPAAAFAALENLASLLNALQENGVAQPRPLPFGETNRFGALDFRAIDRSRRSARNSTSLNFVGVSEPLPVRIVRLASASVVFWRIGNSNTVARFAAEVFKGVFRHVHSKATSGVRIFSNRYANDSVCRDANGIRVRRTNQPENLILKSRIDYLRPSKMFKLNLTTHSRAE
jgi:hypothetical protein